MRISCEIWDTKFIGGKRGVCSKGMSPGTVVTATRMCRLRDETRKGSFGKPALIGVKQEIIPEQAKGESSELWNACQGTQLRQNCQKPKVRAGIAPPSEYEQGRHPGLVRIHHQTNHLE